MDAVYLKSKHDTWSRKRFKNFHRGQLAKIYIFNILIGNKDFEIRVDGGLTTRNIVLLQLKNGTILPITYDFDLAIMVSGRREQSSPDPSVRPSFVVPDLEWSKKEIRLELMALKKTLQKHELNDGLSYFKTKIPVLRNLLRNATMDEEGRELIEMRLNAFEQMIDTFVEK